MADLKAFAEQLVNLTVKEVNELATCLLYTSPFYIINRHITDSKVVTFYG